jgi:hypothetical protein
MMFRAVFWDDSSLMMEAARTSETSVDNHFTRQYNPEDSSEHQYVPCFIFPALICMKLICLRANTWQRLAGGGGRHSHGNGEKCHHHRHRARCRQPRGVTVGVYK